ncbi:MAG: ATP-dependent endonuclease [Flavobacteriales bacterium]|nr:ATP-dependent endonuclease [Flavobacteriales bacterium]
MNSAKLIQLLNNKFPFEPTSQQTEVIKQLSEFVENSSSNSLFLLKGYAGTGKTTLVSSLINSLWSVGKKVVLLAPTGRAAKVLSVYSKKSAFTIHKKIYWMRTNSQGNTFVTLQENKHTNTIFVVDEASMIPDASDKGFGGRVLLDDLIEYVYYGVMCKLVLIGDTAQLPPVHLDISPALDENLLGITYRKDVYSAELTQVVRQQSTSMVLENATHLRDRISANDFDTPHVKCNSEVVRLDVGMDIQEALEDAYSNSGVEGTVVICRSNKRANLYNQQIRARIRGLEDDISTGDFLMVVRNNYFWLPEGSKAGFIANGDMVEVMRIYEINELYDCRFARISVRLVDYPDEENLECIVLLDTLTSETPAMTYEEYKKLYDEVAKDYADIPKRAQRNKEIKQNPYFNALQVKFAYAITCHKSQGGQWENVFVEQGYFTSDMLSKEYFRWLYTALTRTTKKLHLINFKKEFFE